MTKHRSLITTLLLITTNLAIPEPTFAKKKTIPNPYKNLAQYLSKTIKSDGNNEHDFPTSKIQSTLSALSKAQSTLKSIDGASHEFYQRSHSNTIEGSSGRVERSAGRVGCCADALFACELLDWMDMGIEGHLAAETESDQKDSNEEFNEDYGTLDLYDRKVVLKTTIDTPIPMQIIVLYEEDYAGGAGMNHGGIDGLSTSENRKPRGRYLILLKDEYGDDLEKTLECLDSHPEFFELDVGLVSGEVASVNKVLWHTAQKVLERCAECWDLDACGDKGIEKAGKSEECQDGDIKSEEDESGSEGKKDEVVDPQSLPALHFVGRSLAGGVASLAAAITDGSIPMPTQKKRSNTRKRNPSSRKHRGRRSTKSKSSSHSNRQQNSRNADEAEKVGTMEEKVSEESNLLHGFGSGRSSGIALGAPPSISANIKAAFVTSVIIGDDIICRATKASLDKLRRRTIKRLEGGIITKQVGWMTDTLSLTMSSLQSHAHGSEGEEARLSIPGKVYLVRPRKYGGVSSMHEIGRGRDALRAAVLWQLNDVLLSRSLWKHHLLESYIHNLDKVQLREIGAEEDGKLYA